MAFEALEGRVGQAASSRKLIAPASSELSEEKKWPRRRRYAFILGTALLFWGGLIAAIRWF